MNGYTNLAAYLLVELAANGENKLYGLMLVLD